MVVERAVRHRAVDDDAHRVLRLERLVDAVGQPQGSGTTTSMRSLALTAMLKATEGALRCTRPLRSVHS